MGCSEAGITRADNTKPFEILQTSERVEPVVSLGDSLAPDVIPHEWEGHVDGCLTGAVVDE